MRILVHHASLEPGSRMALAAAGLALRGHQVLWSGGAPPRGEDGAPRPLPGCLESIAGGLAPAWHDAEVVLGGARAPLAAAVAGWMSRAHALVLDLDTAALRRWGLGARWAWDSLHATGLVPAEAADGLQRDPPPVPLERLATWSDEPPAGPRAEHGDTEILERACERALARHRARGTRAAVFTDRDGTLVVERGYLSEPGDLELLPGVAEAIHDLRSAGLAVVVISNQSGVGRGFFPLSRVHQAMARLRQLLRERGAELDAIYFCPHRPEAGCACRKPGTELLLRAADDLQLSLAASVFVGDKRLDVQTGHNAGTLTVLLRTGYGRDEERQIAALGAQPPDQVCDGFGAAAAWILARGEHDRPS